MKNFIKHNSNRFFRKGLFLILSFIFSHNSKAQLQLTQCAIDMVKGLDSLVKKTPLSCDLSVISEHRTILSGNCSMTGVVCGSALTNSRFVFNSIQLTDPTEFYLHWPIAITPLSEFNYWGLCYPASAYFGNTSTSTNNNLFPYCGTSLSPQNFVDRIKIKKISGTNLVDEDPNFIKEIKNPRLMTPIDAFWPFVIPISKFTNVFNAAGILVDVTLKDDRTYVGMLWHRYSPEGLGSSYMMNWKEPITCNASIGGLTVTDLGTTPGPCNKIQLSVNLLGSTAATCPNITVVFNHGDGSPLVVYSCVGNTSYSDIYTYVSPGAYTASVTIYGPGTCIQTITTPVNITCPPPCYDCIPSFAPEPNKAYVISAWVKQAGAAQSTTTYVNPKITVNFTPPSTTPTFFATGDIIDGWQRIEGQFTIPAATTNLDLKLECVSGNCFFDDVRVFPVDGSMKSYVYDPVTMRLVAELDERNYATLYEYDEEGKLIRVKKETEKGKMTIQENRNNTKK